jgi:hypothetical protein
MRHERRYRPALPGTVLDLGACPGCGKHRYLTRRDAKRAITQARDRRIYLTRAYRCGDYWHVTSSTTPRTTYQREAAS